MSPIVFHPSLQNLALLLNMIIVAMKHSFLSAAEIVAENISSQNIIFVLFFSPKIFLKICFQCCAKVAVNKLKCDTGMCRFLYGPKNESFEDFPFNQRPINLNANELCLECCCMQFKLN